MLPRHKSAPPINGWKVLSIVLTVLLFVFLGFVGHLVHRTLNARDQNYVRWCEGQGGTYYLYGTTHLCLRNNQPINPPIKGWTVP